MTAAQWDMAASQALTALLLQAVSGSFSLLWLMPPEAGRQFYSTIGKSLYPIAWVVVLIAYALRQHLPTSALVAIAVVALCVTLYTYGILHDNPFVNVVPHAIGTVAGFIAVWGTAEPHWLSRAHALAGALFSGTATVGMILGHWFIVRPRMSIQPLLRTVHALFALTAVNAALTLTAVAPVWQQLPQIVGDLQTFLWAHLILGFGATALVSAVALFCARERSTQAATGFLYLAMLCVLIGELCRCLIAAATPLPL
ncbi:hypothetical protein HRbin17_01709 [bacterium HR17]|jgi:uncharacterized membrane protein|uniref:Uncharacterized protein n=1 Tax=Candidatus Fervidibacter japonicus TaxID=2035412 RepID=A0A2H5XDC6_9BACT|nr:hypothetical protein HRbin17_01709 [bacterium HR17]